jgi:hypothetical protein
VGAYFFLKKKKQKQWSGGSTLVFLKNNTSNNMLYVFAHVPAIMVVGKSSFMVFRPTNLILTKNFLIL